MDSTEPASDCKHVDHVLEVERCFFEACCEPPHIRHFAEETLNDVAHGHCQSKAVEWVLMAG